MRRPQDINVRQHEALTTPPLSRRMALVLGFVGLIVGLDQFTKQLAFRNLGLGPCSSEGACIDLFWTLRINVVLNPGASFSTGASFGPVIGALSLIMTVVMFVLAVRTSLSAQRWIFAAIAGGALGNGLDRLLRAEEGFLSGEVIDFIDFQWWPVFNVADIAIVCSVVAAMALTFLAPERMSPEHGGVAPGGGGARNDEVATGSHDDGSGSVAQ